MTTPKTKNAGDEGKGQAPAKRRWPAMVAVGACSCYVVSALTLPFANAIWLGEFPPLALIQLPKSLMKFLVHDLLLAGVSALGWSQGSRSPDYIATHDWALGIAMAAPALLLVSVFLLARRVSHRGRLVAMVLVGASLDAIVTFWFERASSLKLFNASYF